MLVAARGVELVCARRVHIIRDYPTVAPITGLQALEHEKAACRYGWRSQRFSGVPPQWRSLHGHPVAEYENRTTGERSAVLLWLYKGAVQDFYLGNMAKEESCVSYDPLQASAETIGLFKPWVRPENQQNLF